MIRNDPSGWWREGMVHGQHKLADTLRVLVFKTAPALFDRLDFEDDQSFLDPLLFAYFTSPAPAPPLESLLYARMRPEHRPAFRLRSDANGRVYVPGLGEASTACAERVVELHQESGAGLFSRRADGQVLPMQWRRDELIPNTAIEVMRGGHPLFARFFVDEKGVPVEFEVAQASQDHTRHLVRACMLLREHCPEVWNDIAATTRRVVLYRADLPNSFATLSAHGAIFSNVTTAIDEVFFLEDIAHQGGHVLFNALTLEKERLFTVDPMTSLDSVADGAVEVRSLYAAVHGLFTYTTIGEVLSACYERQAFPQGREVHELLGRLGLVLRKFEADLTLLDPPTLFTRDGRRYWRYFTAVFRRLHARYAARVASFDYSNQPYVFSYPLFAERNPRLPVEVTKETAS